MEHLNKHPVIYFDLYPFMYEWSSGKLKDQTMVQYFEDTHVAELAREYSHVEIKQGMSLHNAMRAIANDENDNHKFIVIIDEWDMVLREGVNEPNMIEDYIACLRSIFRSKDTADYLDGAYMTGILPIIKYNTQSALSDFREYTMLDPGPLAKYVGFTREDIRVVCERYGADEKALKEWYDGYSFPGIGEVYCPSSIIQAAKNGVYKSYWTATSAMESLTDYIY